MARTMKAAVVREPGGPRGAQDRDRSRPGASARRGPRPREGVRAQPLRALHPAGSLPGRRLRKAGFEVLGFDVSEGARELARAEGVRLRDTVADVASDATRAVISLVRDLAQTEAVIFGERGVVSSGRRGLGIVVMSTLSPGVMRALGERAASAGFPVLDAPVSGARAGAEAGTLTIMAAGPRDVHEACRPYFDAMGKNVFHLGDTPGAGQAAKLANNLMLGIAMVGCAEGLRRHGIPEDRLLELLRVSTGSGWVVQHWEDVRRWWTEYRPGTTLDIVKKDLRAVVDECAAVHALLPLTASCLALLMDACHHHEVEVQIVYVIRGWITFRYGVGEVKLVAGSCVHQPAGLPHVEVGHSEDLEMVEIAAPADFRTVND